MKSVSSKKFMVISIVLLAAILLTGCSASLEKGRKPSDDWSRGLPLTDTANSLASIAVDQSTENVHIVWPSQGDFGDMSLHYVQLDERAEKEIEQEIARFSERIRALQLVSGEDHRMHLFWTEQVPDSKQWKLQYAQLDNQGTISGNTIQISDDSSWVSDYLAVRDLDGGVVLLWKDVDADVFYITRISSQGELVQEPVQILQKGETASIGIDSQGEIHLAWMEGNRLFYQDLATLDTAPVEGLALMNIPMGTGDRLDGPILGLVDGWVYVFWSRLSQSGLEAGTAHTAYIAFPNGNPQELSVEERIGILPLEEQPFQKYTGAYNLSQWVPVGEIIRNSSIIYDPSEPNTYQSELALALAINQNYRLDSYIQIAVALFKSGQFEGYTPGAKTLDISGDAVLTNDSQGNFHMVWRDGAAGNLVYYTTTSPEARDNLDSLGLADVQNVFLTGVLEALTGVLLFPLAFPWMLIGLVLLVIWRLVRNYEDLTYKPSIIIVAIAILSFEVSKFLFMPTILEYVPFSAWIDIPADSQLFIRIGTPLLIFGIAFFFAELLRRKRTSSTLPYFLTVVIVDTVLTLSIYGVNFLGAY